MIRDDIPSDPCDFRARSVQEDRINFNDGFELRNVKQIPHIIFNNNIAAEQDT